jgi:hypothetical protein
MRTYSTADTMLRSSTQQAESPFAHTPDDESTSSQRPGGKMVRNYRKVVTALTRTVSSFDLSRQIYG